MTKFSTLVQLREALGDEIVPPAVAVSRASFERDPDKCHADIVHALSSNVKSFIVRSSGFDEDVPGGGTAGRYLSVPNVPRGDSAALQKALHRVFASMAVNGDGDGRDEVFVQPMFTGRLVAVILTRDPRSGAPYTSVAFAKDSPTDAVTAGGATNVLVVLHGSEGLVDDVDSREILIVAHSAARAIGSDHLDLEVLVEPGGQVRLLQAREMHTPATLPALDEPLRVARQTLGGLGRRRQAILGTGVVLSDMADWNPAEMIGIAPTPLAWSLYRLIIGTSAWSSARSQLGYRTVRAQLLHRLGAHPYVDVRASLTSLVPGHAHERFAVALVDGGVRAIRSNPALHGRAELELSISCIALEAGGLPPALSENLTSADRETARHLAAEMTSRLIDRDDSWSASRLLDRFTTPRAADGMAAGDPTARDLVLYLRGCVAEVALSFSAAARHAFAADRLIEGLRRREVIADDTAGRWRGDVRTVATRWAREVEDLGEGRISPVEFLARFGHLRPGTYDIRSTPYRELDITELHSESASIPSSRLPFRLSAEQKRGIELVCADNGMQVEASHLDAYVRSAIRAREEGKFVLSWHISALLDAIAAFGASRGCGREEMAYLDFEALMAAPREFDDAAGLRAATQSSAAAHPANTAMITGPLVLSERDLCVVRSPVERPTFITSDRVSGPVATVDVQTRPSGRVREMIVCAERLDPGFEWLFSSGMAGLIVRYGGPNSHVAVRCHELGIPAALGCDAVTFAEASSAARVELDCAAEIVVARDAL